jgi:glycosyltransferase involved in cell wall biosynthesis
LARLNRGLIDYGERRADVVIVQSAQQAGLLRSRYGRSDAVYIPNFHAAPAASITKASDRVIVCWIANLKRLKQPELFVRLASDFRNWPDVEFVMVGGQHMRADVWATLLGSMRTLPNLRYLGSQPQAAVEQLLARAHVLVNTSEFEGFPNTFIQAWLREVAVASLGVNPDGVFDADEYGICAGGSYERLRRGLQRLISDPVLRNRIGQRANAFARERFSERNMELIIKLLQSSL